MQTILGAGGAIGTHLAKVLKKYDDHIRLVSRHPQKVNRDDELFPGDLTNKAAVESAITGSRVVYLTAGLEYKTRVWQEQWPVIMQHVVGSCMKHRVRLVFFDNAYMYEPKGLQNLTESTPVRPVSKKGKVRAQIAATLMKAVEAGDLEAMIVRSADFYGPGVETSMLIETVYKKFRTGKKAMWMGKPGCIHSMTYTPDAARATALLGNTPDAYNQIWHLPTENERLTGKDWVELFASQMGVEPKFSSIGGSLIQLMGWVVPFFRELGEMMYQFETDYFFNSEKFEKRFPDFQITPPVAAVKEITSEGLETTGVLHDPDAIRS